MADRDKQIERAREALEEKQEQDQIEAERRELEDADRRDDAPEPRTKSPGNGEES